MLRIFIIISLFAFSSLDMFGQTCEVIFKCKNKNSISDSLEKSRDKVPPEQIEILLSLKKKIDNYHINFAFIQDGNISSFIDRGNNTNVLKEKVSNGKVTYYLEEKDDRFYKDFTNNILIANKQKHGRIFYIRESFPDFCWNFTSEKKEILGYTCKKAIINDYYGEEITAWFASEIPIPNGPVEFGGLPGLILELTTNSLKYEATEITLNSKVTSKIKKPKQKEKQVITMAEFFEKTKKVKSFGKKGK